MESESSSTPLNTTTELAPVCKVPIIAIDEPPAPLRESISQEAIAELADSLERLGQLQAIILKQNGTRFTIIAGHRRFLAARLLGWNFINGSVVTGDALLLQRMSIAENIQREDLTPLEEARIVYQLHHQQGLELRTIMHMLNKGEGWVQARLDIAFMPDYIKDELACRKLSIGVARELMDIGDEEHRRYLVGMAVSFGCTVRMAQSWKQQWAAAQPMKEATDAAPTSVAYTPNPGEVTMPCWFCSSQTTIPMLSVLRFCPDCLKAADAARTGILGEKHNRASAP
jgi:ParB/RepB/Spo0J family partition protein